MTGNQKQGLLFWGGAVLIMLLTVYLLRFHIAADIQPWGDYAADLLLTREITEDGYLLTGHYSRFGFNHPGPFFFYLNHEIEILLSGIGISTYGSWILATTLFNNGCLFIAVWMLSRQWSQPAAIATLAVITALMAVSASDAMNLWMPYRLVMPFMAFTCALMLVLRGRFNYLFVATLLACILIHGYITLPLIVLPSLLFAVVVHVFRRRCRLSRREKGMLLVSAGIGLIFALPIVADKMLHSPSNLDYFRLSMAVNPAATFDVSAALQFLFGLWNTNIIALCGAVVILSLSLLAARRLPLPRPLVAYAVMLLVISVPFLLLHAMAPRPLYEFVGTYYRGVVLALIALLLCTALYEARNAIVQKVMAIVLMAGSLLFYVTDYRPVPTSPGHLKAISAFIVSTGRRSVQLDFQPHELFADMAGIIYDLRAAGVDACVVRPAMLHLFTANATCRSRQADYVLVSDSSCQQTHCEYVAAPLAIISVRH